jgi:hypothetical protein
MTLHPALSVVVIGRNEGARLKRCLDSVKAMRVPAGGVEIIYVDSDSGDESPRIAGEAGARVIVLRPQRPTAALGRDTGWRASLAPFILFVDGDPVIHPDFVTHAMPDFANPKVAVVFGRTCEIDSNTSVFSRVYDLDWPYPPPGPAEFCIGTALMRRPTLEAVNGHDCTLMAGEEPEICYRLRQQGYVILCLDLPMARHDLTMSRWSQYWRRNVRRGYGDAEVSGRFRKEDAPAYTGRTRHTRIWGPLLVLSPLIAAAGSVAAASWLPLAVLLVAAVALVLRTARSCRHRTDDRFTCVLFSVHWYLKEIPLLFGQLRYFFDKYTGNQTLIEYKTVKNSR